MDCIFDRTAELRAIALSTVQFFPPNGWGQSSKRAFTRAHAHTKNLVRALSKLIKRTALRNYNFCTIGAVTHFNAKLIVLISSAIEVNMYLIDLVILFYYSYNIAYHLLYTMSSLTIRGGGGGVLASIVYLLFSAFFTSLFTMR